MKRNARTVGIAGGLALFLLLIAVAGACQASPTPTPTATPAPTATPTALPKPSPTPTPLPPIGMKLGERYHAIHTTQLALGCAVCHSASVAAYSDPLAPVSNLADRRACLGCHKEGSALPLFGEDWARAKVGRE